MTFAAFVLSFGALMVLMGLIAAWLFRTGTAPLWAKITVPSLMVGLGCYAPFAVAQMMGFPTSAALPEKAELIAFFPHDEAGMVDLWLKSGDEPRAYETKLTSGMKKVLLAAKGVMDRGGVARLAKNEKHRKVMAGDPLGIGDDQMLYELDLSAMSPLPAKD